MSRYHNIEYIMNTSIEDGMNIIIKAYEKDTKDKLYQMYVANSPYMDKDNYISFEQFCSKSIGRTKNKCNKTENKETVHEKVDNILKAMREVK